MRWHQDICDEAKNYAKEYYVNEEKEKAFKNGVLWVVGRLERMVAPSHYDSMMDASTKQFMNKLTVADVRRLCDEVKIFVKEASGD